jgi:hypothetical protein
MSSLRFRSLFGWCCLVAIALGQDARAAESRKTPIMDYFVQLPSRTFEAPAPEMLHFLEQPGTVIDKENGYLRCKGDG